MFDRPTIVPGKSGTTELRGDITQENVDRWTIEFSPAWQHFRITHYPTGNKQSASVMLHASRAMWEPA